MSDEGDRECPLCMEEMDLTDQHLRPCKCRYEICVWCWNHIMDMAEKEETEGKCPACRTPYDMEKIVGTTVNCESWLAETTSERKQNLQKSKTKTLEVRKNLSNVRVIQRNLVYVVGIPPILADEQILERKEYFGQYGKVLKVSISRTSAGAPHATHNTFSVYITYMGEDEATRCIQAVNGFLLEGKPLKAHYGTTKYCQAWLKNMPCSNQDCLYLHDIGTQDDSFTKDEAISPCIRTKVQQTTVVSSNLQRRAGSVLPPPVDEYCNGSISISGKSLPKTSTCISILDTFNQITSPPDVNPIRSSALPAAASWGLRAANGTVTSSTSISQGSSTRAQGPYDAFSSSLPTNTVLASSSTSAALKDSPNLGVSSSWEADDNHSWSSERITANVPREVPSDPAAAGSSNRELSDISSPDIGHRWIKSSVGHGDLDSHACSPYPKGATAVTCIDEALPNVGTVSSSSSSPHLCKIQASNLEDCSSEFDKPLTHQSKIVADSVHVIANHEPEAMVYQPLKRATEIPEQVTFPMQTDSSVHWEAPVLGEAVSNNVFLSNDLQGISHLQTTEPAKTLYSFSPSTISNRTVPLPNNGNVNGVNSRQVNSAKEIGEEHHFNGTFSHELNFHSLSCSTSNGFVQDDSKIFGSSLYVGGISVDSFDFGGVGHARSCMKPENIFSAVNNETSADCGERSIISNILSMNLDESEDPLHPAQCFSDLLFNDKVFSSNSTPRKTLGSAQSRFSFARQEDSVRQTKSCGPGRSCMENNSSMLDAGEVQGEHVLNQATSFPVNTLKSANSFTSHRACVSANKTSLRSTISAPPGFGVPARHPPPGFSSVDRVDPLAYSAQDILEQTFNISSRTQQLDNGSASKNLFNTPASIDSTSSFDVELIDPAIMAVGKGKHALDFHHSILDFRLPLSTQSVPFDRDPRIQLLPRSSCLSGQNSIFSGNGGLSHLIESLNTDLSMYEPSSYKQQLAGVSWFGNGQQEGLFRIQGGAGINLLAMAKNREISFDNRYPVYDGLRFHTPTSNDVYRRAFEK